MVFKRLLILTLLYFSSFIAHPQNIEWQRTIGGNNFDYFYSIRSTSDGGSICIGESGSIISGEKTENGNGSYDFWILKLDRWGNIQWDRSIGGSSLDSGKSIHQTSDGGYICGGWSYSPISGDKTANSALRDYWIVKLDSQGNKLWDKTYGGNEDDELYFVNQTTDGGYFCAGFSVSGISGDKTEVCRGLEDIWVLKLDSVGNIQWQKTIGGDSWDKLASAEVTSDRGIILGASSYSSISGDKTEARRGDTDFWIIKLDEFGNISWQKTLGGNSEERLFSIIQTLEGGYIAAGSSNSNISGDKTVNCKGMDDMWVVKLDDVGNIQWQNSYGGYNLDWAFGIAQFPDGNYACLGYSVSLKSGNKTESTFGSEDYWVLKLDTIGNIIWQKDLGGISSDVGLSLHIGLDNSIVLGGYSRSPISGNKTEDPRGTIDYWILKMESQNNRISGTAYIDLNSDNAKDTNEPVVRNRKIQETNSGHFAFTDEYGQYSLYVSDSGNYNVTPFNILSYHIQNPLSHNISFNGINKTDSLNDFAFQSMGVFSDLAVKITPLNIFRSARQANYSVDYSNVGTTPLNATLVFFPDQHLTFVSSSQNPVSINSDSINYNLGQLPPFAYGKIIISFILDPSLQIGTIINSYSVIEPFSGDDDPSNNHSWWEVSVMGSLDPNDIIVNRSKIYDYEIPTSPWLDYIIRFQNTGNDTAFYVRVDNKIPENLELSEFEFVSSSHPVDLFYRTERSQMEFTFNNILLPDSNVNEPMSHGFVRYRIRTKNNLILGDTIQSFASIFFDSNAPVLTNTAMTRVVSPSGLINQLQLITNLFPNPSKNEITLAINGLNNRVATIEISNMYGQNVMHIHTGKIDESHWSRTIDISDLKNGMYFIKISGAESKAIRFIKN